MTKKHVTDKIVKMYVKDRLPILHIAYSLRVAPTTVWRWLHRRNVKMRPAGGGTYKDVS